MNEIYWTYFWFFNFLDDKWEIFLKFSIVYRDES